MNRVYLKKDTIRYIAKDSGYSQRVVSDILESYHNLLVDVVGNGDRIQDFGFLDMSSVYVPEHYRTDPRDNTIRVKVKPKFKVKISIGKTLRDTAKKAINNIDINELKTE